MSKKVVICINIYQLQYILAVADHASVSKAAAALSVSQPYLSRIIRELEEEQGVKLFCREKNGFYPTNAGREFFEESRRILQEISTLQDMFKGINQEPYSFSVYSMRTSISESAFIHLYNQYQDKRYMRFIYMEEEILKVIEAVGNRTADIGVLYINNVRSEFVKSYLHSQSVAYQVIALRNSYVVVRSGHPLTKLDRPLRREDLYPYSTLVYRDEEQYLMGKMPDRFGSMDINWKGGRIQVSSRAALHNVLRQTDSFSIGDQGIRNQEEKLGLVSLPMERESFIQDCTHELLVIYRENGTLSQTQKSFLNYLKEVVD